jgi:CYTH domain-containing protein
MTEPISASPGDPLREGKYARIERERRFLLAEPPPVLAAPRRITDRYLMGTRLRLRRVEYSGDQASDYKFTQKISAGRPGPVQGLITNTYLSRAEYDLLAALPGAVLAKTRFSAPPLVIDIFDPPRHGLVLAEAEFSTDDAALSFLPPPHCIAEVTSDTRFTGGRLAQAHRHDLLGWLAEYGIHLDAAPQGPDN